MNFLYDCVRAAGESGSVGDSVDRVRLRRKFALYISARFILRTIVVALGSHAVSAGH